MIIRFGVCTVRRMNLALQPFADIEAIFQIVKPNLIVHSYLSTVMVGYQQTVYVTNLCA